MDPKLLTSRKRSSSSGNKVPPHKILACRWYHLHELCCVFHRPNCRRTWNEQPSTYIGVFCWQEPHPLWHLRPLWPPINTGVYPFTQCIHDGFLCLRAWYNGRPSYYQKFNVLQYNMAFPNTPSLIVPIPTYHHTTPSPDPSPVTVLALDLVCDPIHARYCTHQPSQVQTIPMQCTMISQTAPSSYRR